MLTFAVYDENGLARDFVLQHAHLLGHEDIGMQGEIEFEDGLIECTKRSVDAAALAVMVDVGDLGRLILQTCRLPDRDEPYLLHLELARYRIKTFLAKSEEWQILDLASDHPSIRQWEEARSIFTTALTTADPKRHGSAFGNKQR